jgi:hypothetical protein
MKKQIFSAILLAGLTLLGVFTYLALNGPNTSDDTSNAAFRDGSYEGTQDGKTGNVPHLALARWPTSEDRAAFVHGYKTAYEGTLSAISQDMLPATASAPYTDGLYVGKLDAQQGRDAHPMTGRWWQARDKQLFSAGYRKAYLEQTVILAMRNNTSSVLSTAEVR